MATPRADRNRKRRLKRQAQRRAAGLPTKADVIDRQRNEFTLNTTTGVEAELDARAIVHEMINRLDWDFNETRGSQRRGDATGM